MLESLFIEVKKASNELKRSDTATKNKALLKIAELLIENQADILAANQKDIDAGKENGLTDALIDRLLLNEKRINGMVEGVNTIIGLEDPTAKKFDEVDLEYGLKLWKQRVPMGVLAVIYESRPNVTIDITALGLKAGNAVILRGGKETLNTNQALYDLIVKALKYAGLPEGSVQFINNPDRSLVYEILGADGIIDMIIPRGGDNLQKVCRENTNIPVMTGGIGVCHLYVDEEADLERSVEVVANAKLQRPSVCNALDSVLVNGKVAKDFLTQLFARLENEATSYKLDQSLFDLLGIAQNERYQSATEEDYYREWLSLVMNIKPMKDVEEAIAHIQKYSTGHSDGILTDNMETAQYFIRSVDSAAVYINASTRFTDGEQFGLGGEVAISTQRFHARGPVALKELTTYKWVGVGDYLVRK
ncbi:MAG: glutamate-5-semialdehyde dehydrogenase [Anaerolineales bacterium]|nr:glutamate-5-semialdehyde dehydrogenase [Anaerolineales bacterium]